MVSFVIMCQFVRSCVSVWSISMCVSFVIYRGVLHGLCLCVLCVVGLCVFKVCLCDLIVQYCVMLHGLFYVCFVRLCLRLSVD